MRVCSRFRRCLTPHHHPHPTAASQRASKPPYPSPPSRGKEGAASRPLASAGLRQEEEHGVCGRCLPGHDRLGWPSTGCERLDPGKHKRGPTRPCHDEHPAGRARSLPPDFSRLIATVWWSRRSRRPHGAGLVARTSQRLHTRRVLERITELARFVKHNRRPGPDPGPRACVRSCAVCGWGSHASWRPGGTGPGSSPGRRHPSWTAKRPGFWPGLFLVRC
jgi:hypothetical protein